MEEVCLKDLFIGLTDGAVEAKEDDFKELFYDPYNKYNDLMNGKEKFLVLGYKGTGKTYLANYIKAKAKNNEYVRVIGENDFTICKLNAISQEKLDEELAIAFCKWFLLDRLGHLIVENRPIRAKYIPISKTYQLKKFINTYENDNIYKDVKKIVDASKENSSKYGSKLSGEKKVLNSSSGTRTKRRYSLEGERKNFFELLPSFEKKVFGAIGKKQKYTIIVDDLDEITNDKNSIGRDEIIISMIKVAREYNLKDMNPDVKFVILLRTDIVDDVQAKYSNLSKTTTTCAVELYWLFDNTSVEPYNHPLMSMILHKIKTKCPVYSNYSNEVLYKILFPESIDNKKPLDYLLDYGFGRPRDFVTFLSCAQTECPEQTCFNARVLKEARKSYSSKFYNELLNQSAYYGNPEFVTQCFQLLSSVKKSSFTRSDMETIYNVGKDNYKYIENVDDVLKFLYKIGAIGNSWKVSKGNIKQTHFGWSYKKDAMNEVDLSKKFTIHYGLRKKFSM